MNMYSKWLNALGRHFFGRHQAGLKVRLSINRKFIDEHFADLGGTASFVNTMNEGPMWKHRDNHPQTMNYRGIALYKGWLNSESHPPEYLELLSELNGLPHYLPYLCLLCLAWTEGEEEIQASHAFYDRLTKLYPEHDLNGHLSSWSILWEGLAEWTKKQDYAHGIFIVERLGGMQYVGIPKSQVIFTPNRVESLPHFFASLNFHPGTEPTPEKIRSTIEANRLTAAQYLGNAITELICKSTNIGAAAIAIILEYLAEWDGTVPGVEHSRTLSGSAQERRKLLVAMESIDPYGWKLQLAVEDGPGAALIRPLDEGWMFQPVNSLFALVTDNAGRILDAKRLLSGLNGAKTIRAAYVSDGISRGDIRFSLQDLSARYFDRWYDDIHLLLECGQLPTNGTVYVLLNEKGFAQWEAWYPIYGSVIQVQDFTETGLPAGWHMIYIEGLALLNAKARESFPGFEDSLHRKASAIWFSSGTRIPSAASRRLYAQYDPPLVHVKAPPEAILLSQGASEAEIVPTERRPRGLPGDVVRTFRLTIDSVEDVVILQVWVADAVFAQTSFGVSIEPALAEVQLMGALQVDRFGNLAGRIGVYGLKCPHDEAADPVNLVEEIDDMEIGTALCSPSFNLLESLSTRPRIPFPEYRRRAMEIAGIDYWSLYQETRWLAHLAHVDIQADSKGRWSHVLPLGRQLMLLPTQCGIKYQASLTGCGTKAQLLMIQQIAKGYGIEMIASGAGGHIAPPRILLRHQDIEALELTAIDSKIEWIAGCAPYSIAKWSASMDDWESGPISWYHHQPPISESEYNPNQYQILPCADGADYASPTRLFIVSDPYVTGHRWHVLVRTNSINEPDTGRQRYAFISDPSWAMWKTHLTIADGDFTILPYAPSTGSILIPRILNMPYLLGRALCACSGLPPKKMCNVPAYAIKSLHMIPECSPAYSGDCWEFRGVPRRIAQEVAAKLSAQLKDI